MSITLSLVSLGMNMVGAAITFFFGYPQPSHEESVGIALNDNTPLSDGITVKQYRDQVRRTKRLYKILSKLGLGLMFLGFALQFFNEWHQATGR